MQCSVRISTAGDMASSGTSLPAVHWLFTQPCPLRRSDFVDEVKNGATICKPNRWMGKSNNKIRMGLAGYSQLSDDEDDY